jgi:hypothetical protein
MSRDCVAVRRFVGFAVAALVHRHRVQRRGQQRQQPVEAARRLGPGMQQKDQRTGPVPLRDVGHGHAGAQSYRLTVPVMHHVPVVGPADSPPAEGGPCQPVRRCTPVAGVPGSHTSPEYSHACPTYSISRTVRATAIEAALQTPDGA